MKLIIYILCYDDKTEQIANENFKEFDWARVYKLTNQNHLFEGKFLSVDLFELYDEWKDADYVGTLSYKAFDKIDKAYAIQKINYLAHKIHDVVFFNVASRICLSYHREAGTLINNVFMKMISTTIPRFTDQKFGLRIGSKKIAYCAFSNYFITRPHLMYQYITFFRYKWLPLLESQPEVWNNASYDGKLTPDELLKLSNGKVSYYTYHAFINERLLYPYFQSRNVRILF
jgi:hypothetical protein